MENKMKLEKVRVVLASKSPRRRELLSKIVDSFEIITRETDETLPEGMHPSEGVGMLAVRKGEAVAGELSDDALVISSDTLVELDGIPLGKPDSEEEAKRMLLTLSGRVHNVHTGVAIHYKGKVFSGSDTSSVTFKGFGEDEAREYVATGEPMDKAGSYAIQGAAMPFICGITGCYMNVVGLPVQAIRAAMLEGFGIKLETLN